LSVGLTTQTEDWLVARVRDHGGHAVLEDILTTEERRERVREAILRNGLSSVLVGRKGGKPETYAAAFQRLYGTKL